MENIKSWIAKRGTIKAKITRFRDYLQTANVDENGLTLRLKRIEPTLAEFENLQDSIEEIAGVDDEERETFENNYFGVLEIANERLRKHKVNQSNIKLPNLQLITFSGNQVEWPRFYETFKSLIHDNETLSNIQRFHYLGSSLKGDAKKLISTLELSDANYIVALELLVGRYDNKRLTVHKHLKALHNLREIKQENHVALRDLIDTTRVHLKSLKNFGLNVDSWDMMIIYLISSKLDAVTRVHWEQYQIKGQLPTLDEMFKCLIDRSQVLEFSALQGKTTSTKFQSVPSNRKEPSVSLLTNREVSCFNCKRDHRIYVCEDFLQLSISERIRKINSLKACNRCLNIGHKANVCRSKFLCRMCKSPQHNTLLHTPASENSSEADNERLLVSNHSMAGYRERTVLLSTAVIGVKDNSGRTHTARALLDNGAQSNFITENFAKRIGLKFNHMNVPISGIQNKISHIHNSVRVEILSLNSDYKEMLSCLVLQNITNNLPQSSFKRNEVNIPEGLILADPHFNTSSRIDILLGAEVFWNILKHDQLKTGPAGTTLQQTELGWIVSGPMTTASKSKGPVSSNFHISLNVIHNQIEKFWKIEEVTTPKHQNHEERACEENFVTSHSRQRDGRFKVRLPFRPCYEQLGDSLKMAEKRLLNLERKFLKNKDLYEQYSDFIAEYSELGHMTECEPDDTDGIKYFLPHHAVLKEDSTTTKTRVVFDGSAKTSSGISLNDALMVGSVIQKDLCSQLISFRKHQIVMTADIEKMYRQILIHEEDRDYQGILWRNTPKETIRRFRLNTVTYGLGPSSFLATRCLAQLGNENALLFPRASSSLKNEFYMDDLLTGADCEEECWSLKQQLTSILRSAGMNLRKWRSNVPILVQGEEDLPDKVISNDDKEAKILGLKWNHEKDYFSYSTNPPQDADYTKRKILSSIATIFDPLGLIGPVTLRAKMILQLVWQAKLDWDEKIPAHIMSLWKSYVNEMPLLNKVTIPRGIICSGASSLQLHGFCDASERAYAACIYMISRDQFGKLHSQLITSKSRVSPLKVISLPKLELCGAVLLSKLIRSTKESLQLEEIETFYWSDSTIALAWIRGQPASWNTFVANRVAEIQDYSSPDKWSHVSSGENAADILSRGCSANQLNNSNWWNGPSWLILERDCWPLSKETCKEPPEIKTRHVVVFTTLTDWDIFGKYSSLSKLQRVVAYMLRFLHNCKSGTIKLKGELSVSELSESLIRLIKIAQKCTFQEEIRALKCNKNISKSSSLKTLNPFMRNELLCVGGRLSKGEELLFQQKHPILLATKHKLTELIIRHFHYQNMHAGAQSLLSIIRQKYWPVMGKNLVKQIIRKCVVCFRSRPRPSHQVMADLPASRITPSRPFSTVGVDYAGPVMTKSGSSRNARLVKSYICLFVCFATKAVHLELVTDLTTDAFLKCLKRFMSRRGKPSKIYSDNATNFVGAAKELRSVYDFLSKHELEIYTSLANIDIEWHFIPPRAPHHGGLWEAGVKSVKFHLNRVVRISVLTYEDLYTVLCQIESCLNSRPLSPLSNDPQDLNSLTPNHFLIGGDCSTVVELDVQSVPYNRLNHYQRLSQLIHSFWSRWRIEYLTGLQQRTRWETGDTRPAQLGDMVVVKEDNLPPKLWRLARITAVHPGADGIIRVVTLKTAQGVMKRPVTKICFLPIEEEVSLPSSKDGACSRGIQ